MHAVIGVSGNTGAVVARSLLDQGEAVRVVVRRPEAAAGFREQGAGVAIADLFDAAALSQALTGATSVYLMTPPLMEVDNVREVRTRLNAVLREAAERAGSPRVVMLSSVAAHLSAGTGPIATLHDLEQRFADYPGAVTALRAPFFLENWGDSLGPALSDGILPSMLAEGVAIDMASTADIGRTAAALMIEGGPRRRTVALHSAQRYAAADIAEELGRELDRPITAVYPPREQWVGILTGAGLSPDGAALMAELFDGVNDGRVRFAEEPERRVAEETPGDVLRRLLPPVAA